MLLLLVLPILISGYIAFTSHPYHYYRLHRYEGQLLYLESAKIGLLCTTFGVLFVSILNFYVPANIVIFSYSINVDVYNYVRKLISKIAYNNASELTWVLLITSAALITAKVYAFLGKIKLRIKAFDFADFLSWRRIKLSFRRGKLLLRHDESSLGRDERARILLMSSILKDSPIDYLFFKSYVIDGFFIMLTMEDRKLYIGRVVSLGEPNELEGMDQEITITPYASGYRDKDDLRAEFTTKYSEISSDVSLTLRQDKIISATHFDENVYEEFQRQKTKRKQFRLP